MMPSFKRFGATLVTFVAIFSTTLHSTIAKPFESGEGEASLTNGYGHPPMMMRIGPEMSIGPYMFMRNPYQQNIYDASNVQINYNDDKGQDDGLISEDETSKNEAIPRRRNVQRRLLVNNNFNEDEAPPSDDEMENIVPRQDEGEQESEEEGNSDDELTAQNSQNIAYSYSHFQPNHHLTPNRLPAENERLVDHNVPQLSFIFHPTVLRGTQPNLVLHELKSFALQLDESPIMNALFSPSTVPIPPTQPAWPSKYEAKKYLPPNLSLKRVSGGYEPEVRKSMTIDSSFLEPGNLAKLEELGDFPEKTIFPFLRRSLIQVDGQNLSPEALEQLNSIGNIPSRTVSTIIQNSMAQNAEAFNNFMQKSFTFPQTLQVSRAFNRGTNAMNNFFNNQLRIPQFPTFQNYANQFQNPNHRVYSQNRIPNQNQQYFPQLQTFPAPYISPSLREMIDPEDGIDVRIDSRPDSENDKILNPDLQNGSQVVQIGDGNTNYDSQSFVQTSEDFDKEIKETLPMNDLNKPDLPEVRLNDDEVGNDDVPDVEISQNKLPDLTKEYGDPAKFDMVKADDEEGIMGQGADFLMTEETAKALDEVMPTNDTKMSDELPINDQLKEESADDEVTTMVPLMDENAITEINDVEQTTMIEDEVETTMNTLEDENETTVTTENSINDEMTTEPYQDETTTQFEFADRISPSLVASLSG